MGQHGGGRPKKRWIQGTEKVIHERGKTLEEAKLDYGFLDRELWRYLEAGRGQADDPTLASAEGPE